jgi:hypothetical protein
MEKVITDGQELRGASYKLYEGGKKFTIPVYDDEFGPLWLMLDSMGIVAIVRAQTWEDAYNICEDEFFPEADMTVEEMEKEYTYTYTYTARHVRTTDSVTIKWKREEVPVDNFTESELWQEAYGFRPNGPNQKDKHKHGIYAKDLNGEQLIELTHLYLDYFHKRYGKLIQLDIVDEDN